MKIALNNISKRFDKKVVADGLSYDFSDIGLYLLTGRSGEGKSTLLKMIAGLVMPDSGEIINDSGVSYAFQEDRLFPWLRVSKNAAIAGKQDIAEQYLDRLGLSKCKSLFPDELSGGMCRRVSLARAFAHTGIPLLIDEPFRGLDDELKQTVRDIIREQSKERLVICATHEKELFTDAKAVITLQEGRFI